MRSFILATCFAGAAVAQGSGNLNLHPCGQVCVSNMLGLSVSLGCPLVNGNPDHACLCGKADFGYGIRDCANEYCPQDHVGSVMQYGLSYCQATAAIAAPAGGNTPTPAAVSALSTPKYPASNAGETKVASASPSESQISAKTKVADLVSTYTSGSNTFTTTFQSSVNVLATGVSESDASVRGLYNNSTLTSKKNEEARASSTFQAEASTTGESSSSSVSEGGVSPMVTGVLSGLVKAPIVVAAAVMML